MKHKPRKPDDVTILRTMLLNINEHSIFTASDYNLTPERFNAYLSALIQHGIASCATELPVESSEDLIISNILLFEAWNTSYNKLLRFVKELILPIFQTIIATAMTAAMAM